MKEAIALTSDERIAETSSRGNQEKWYDQETGRYYKLDQFGYEALAETVTSGLLTYSNIESDTPFSFVRYRMERLRVHGAERIGCSSADFLLDTYAGWSIVTVHKILTQYTGGKVRDILAKMPSDRKRLLYLADAVTEYTGLAQFPRYLSLLFAVDTLILNEDRHLNNIAVLEKDGTFEYCPLFDNGAAFLSAMQFHSLSIDAKALMRVVRACPFQTTFAHQKRVLETEYGKVFHMPRIAEKELCAFLDPAVSYYPEPLRPILRERVKTVLREQLRRYF